MSVTTTVLMPLLLSEELLLYAKSLSAGFTNNGAKFQNNWLP
jgi:hypothetical protein